VESLISGILRPVEFATLPISGVFAETPLPLVCLFDAKDCARWRESGKIACEEFWRAREGGLCVVPGQGCTTWLFRHCRCTDDRRRD
jgi:hypothetical protein